MPWPWKWSERQARWALVAIAAVVVVGGLVSILTQGGSDDEISDAPAATVPPDIRKLLDSLSPAQKADSVIISGIEQREPAVEEIGSSTLGGVVIGPEDWQAGGRSLLTALRSAGSSGGRIPPLIVGLQEGGVYRAYPDLPPADGESEIGADGNPKQAADWAERAGKSLKAAGFDMNLSPIADVAGLDSPISDRAFGDDPELVASMTGGAVRGCAASGIACGIPYFPGLGAASGDTSLGPATVSLDSASMEVRDLKPFQAAIDNKAPAIVISLGLYAAYDPVTPAALSPSVSTNLLRDQLGFKGVSISDDLTKGAITAGQTADQAAVQAIAAGTDLVLIDSPSQAAAARTAIRNAVASGGIPPARMDEAIARILRLKQRLGLIPGGARAAAKKEPAKKPEPAGKKK